ncbi:sterol desaturase family protein [Nostoc sp. C117]|uniref:sterol desaturase family protein n=1 Tax=Nostoc sp. C117 TaxID=3349875 RepID=UPI00370DD156
MKLDLFTPELISVLLWLAFGKLLIIGLFTILNDLPSKQKLRVFNIKISREQTIRELKAIWVVFTDVFALTLLVGFSLIRLASDSPTNILVTFVTFFLWIEVWFYWTHRWMHKSDFLWKIHEYHHLSQVNQPLTATSFSIIEKFVFYTCGWFLLPTLISWYIPISADGIALYFTYYYISSAIAHSNTEFTYSIQKHLPFGLDKFSGSGTGHALHHARYDTNFGLLSSILDRIFGTYAEDTEKIQEKVSLGEALENLQVIIE